MDFIYNFLLVCLSIIVGLVVLYFVLVYCWYAFYYIFKKMRKVKGEYKYIGFGNFFKKIFIEFPRQKAYDIISFNPDTFRDYGFHLITGKQGTGKTITLVYLLLRYQKMYPKLKVKTNMYYKFQDGEIQHWKDLVNSENGIYGEIDVIDEVQNWFSSNQSKDFPPEMLREVTQQRKQRKMIIGTSQVFTRVSKAIRENVYLVYEPLTIFGCITIVRAYEPTLDTNGTVVSKKPKKTFFFVHNNEIRNAFDTYQKILDMSESGFKENNNQLDNLQVITNTMLVKKK